jgi:UDP-2,4-diacetamido-2,4,6-trideoxy-beta-L-altropyranose hydrolase
MIRVRKARRSDSNRFFTWRNDPLVVASSFTKTAIDIRDHERWYDQKLASDNCEMFVVEYENQPAGQVRFDIAGAEATVNYSLDAAFRGRGLAAQSMSRAIAAFSKDRKEVTSLVALVKQDNMASHRVFEKLEFAFDGVDDDLQADRYRLNLFAAAHDGLTGD